MSQTALLTDIHSAESNGSIWQLATDAGTLSLAFPRDDIARIAFTPHEAPPHISWSLRPDLEPNNATNVDIERDEQSYTLSTSALSLTITLATGEIAISRADSSLVTTLPGRSLVRQDDGLLACKFSLENNARIYGGGLRTCGLNQRGRALTLWATDPCCTHDDDTDALYQSISFFLIGDHEYCGLFFDTTCRATADLGKTQPDTLGYSTSDTAIELYACAGPTPAAVLEQYTFLTGRISPPARWSLGYQQSRWSYMTEDEVQAIATTFREQHIPCDAIYLDIDYMDGYRDFTWNKERFPDPAKMIADLRAQGFRVVPIIDPGIKVDEAYSIYQEGLEHGYYVRNPDGTPYEGWVWPGRSVWADFAQPEVRAWWGKQHQSLLNTGVAGIWDDMNEPSQTGMSAPADVIIPIGATLPNDTLHGPTDAPISHFDFHNMYGLAMCQATYAALRTYRPDERPFLLSRSAAAGSQRYACVWNGDNSSIWPHVRLAITFNLGIGLSGFPISGCDIGGFGDNAEPELLTRFSQLGAFLPFCRNHSCTGTVHQEPWAFGEPYTSIIRTAIERRYQLLPLYVTLAHEAMLTGAPIIRPLFWHTNDPAVASCEDEFLVGRDLLVAPVIEKGATERTITLPEGHWFGWDDRQLYSSGTHTLPVTLKSVPVFLRAGSIIPRAPIIQHTGMAYHQPLELHIYLAASGQSASCTLWDDDDHPQSAERGTYAEYQVSAIWRGTAITVNVQQIGGKMAARYPAARVVMHLPSGVTASPTDSDILVLAGNVQQAVFDVK
jgi:alpha-glucosidase